MLPSSSPILDPKVIAVIKRLEATDRHVPVMAARAVVGVEAVSTIAAAIATLMPSPIAATPIPPRAG